MSYTPNILAQVLNFANRLDFRSKIKDTQNDRYVKSNTSWTVFVSLVYAHLSKAQSMRHLVQMLEHETTKYKHLGINGISRNGLSYALMHRNSSPVKEMFFELLSSVGPRKSPFGNKGSKFIAMLDATHMPFRGTGSEWAESKSRCEAKAHVLMSNDGIPLDMLVTNASISDVKGAEMLDLDEIEVLLMDRAYYGFPFWSKLTKKGIIFVTRAKENMKYKIISKRKGRKPEGIIKDEIVLFENSKNRKQTMELRRIEVMFENKLIVILSNDLTTSANVLADMYKSRWHIELFFKWIKQNLKIKRFFGRSRNAIEVQLWTAMIVYLLMWMIKKDFKYKGSITQLIRLISQKLTINIRMGDLLRPHNKTRYKEDYRILRLNLSGQ